MASSYTFDDLPPAYQVAQGIETFFASTHATYSIMTRTTASDMFKNIYGDTNDALKSQSQLAELCALAAVGLGYLNEPISPDNLPEKLIRTAKLALDECIDSDILRALRITILCTVFYSMRKSPASAVYSVSGFQLASLILNQHKSGEKVLRNGEWDGYHRNFQTLIFLYTVLITTNEHVGLSTENLSAAYANFLNSNQVLSLVSQPDADTDMGNIAQREMAKISIITNQFLNECSQQITIDAATINAHLRTSQEWFDNLPPAMQLGSLLTNQSPKIVRPFFLAHLVHLSSIILATRKVFVDVVSETVRVEQHFENSKYFQGPKDLALKYSTECLMAAEHTTRIIAVISSEGLLFKRCWAMLHSIYLAFQVLLLSSSIKKHANPAKKVNLTPVVTCMDALKFCSTIDPMAQRYETNLKVFYAEICNANDLCKEPEGYEMSAADISQLIVSPDDPISTKILAVIVKSISNSSSDRMGIDHTWNGHFAGMKTPRPIRRVDNACINSVNEAISNGALIHSASGLSELGLPPEVFTTLDEETYEYFQRTF